ncbi:GNAT family N-acetyltransferase [Paenibacillus sp. NPDC056579]|uniref:GNAT family N-acetyltransferase n=1 Tax=Paenibacillus sp. NPDC056579 TaxID=3345871 RepID=UPI0036A05585
MKVHIVELDRHNLHDASRLLLLYRQMDPTDDSAQSQSIEALERLLSFPNASCLLARTDDGYVGFLSYSWGLSTSKGLPVFHIQALFTAPEHRRQGVAQALLNRAAAIAEAHGAHRMQLETDLDNDAARSLYSKFGFEWISPKIVYMYPMQQWHRPAMPAEGENL